MKHLVLLWLRIDCSRSVERRAPQLLRPVTDGGRSMKWLVQSCLFLQPLHQPITS